MKLQKKHEIPEGWTPVLNRRRDDGSLPEPGRPEGIVLNEPRVASVSVIHTGWRPEQKFATKTVAQALQDGWMSLGRDELTVHADQGDLHYRITRHPGRYCCHCAEKLEDDATGDMARAHVAGKHAGVASPDPENPSGYCKINAYECILDEAQHKRWGVKKDPKTGVPVLPARQGRAVANLVFNISLGRMAEFYNRVDLNDPAAAELVVSVINAGAATDATLRDLDDFADVEADPNAAEVTNAGYAKKVLGDVDIVAFAPDDVNDRVDLIIPDQTWTGVAAGDAWTDIIVGYDPVGAQTESDIINGTLHDFVVTPDGTDITADVPAAGFYRASPV